MTRVHRLALLGVLVLAITASAVAPPPTAKPAALPAVIQPALKRAVKGAQAPEQLDYIFFASDRPVLIRLHLQIGDKPYSVAWETWMDKLFAWFDKDKNGYLDAKEVGRLLQGPYMQNQINGSIGNPSGQAPPFTTLDTNKDGKVSKEEFRTYYRNNGFNSLRFSNSNYQARSAQQTNASIYRHLGLKPDAQLRKEDAARLVGLMPKLDEDEDEMLTSAELNTDSNDPNTSYATPVKLRLGRMQPQQAGEPGLVEIGPNMPVDKLVQQMIRQYDKNKDGKLTAGELAPSFFAELDMDGDGKLDKEELKAYFRRPPDLVFRARVGPLGNSVVNTLNSFGLRLPVRQTPRAEVLNPTQPLAKKVRTMNADTLGFDLGDARFALQASEGTQYRGRLEGVKNFYLQQFDAIVDKKKGYLDKKQEKDNRGNPYVFMIFNQADKNGDDKLTRKELIEWMDLLSEGGNSFVQVQVDDMGRSLYNLIDTNSDSRLSLRELRTAWARMKPLCKEGKGLVQADLPRTLRITMGLGGSYFAAPTAVAFTGGMTAAIPRAPTTSVPAWFTKMDLNRDGDVSPREWLGTEEEFKEIDTDGDGLISADEARQFEARKKKDATKNPTPAKKP